jgi:SNF2 family DNA or RNA helicase
LLEDLARLIADESSGVAIDPAVRALVAEELAHSTRVQRGRAEAPRLLRQLDSLGRKLYPYQLEGVERFITHGRLLLADDMGLGKTTQAIAACHALLRSKKVRRGLLIVPAALKPQWVREWQATTNIAIASVDGSPESRARVYRQPKTPFLVIGYEQLLKDLSLVHEFSPDVVVLDEAQRIKNSRSQAALALKGLRAQHRLCLSGTPLENHLGELWSLMDFVCPGLLGSELQFRERYRQPIEKRQDHLQAQHLARRVRPFILRRTKQQVAQELPAKTETLLRVELSGAQADLYETVRATMDEKLRDAIEKQGLARSQIMVLDALLKLRQVCCDPRLLKGEARDAQAAAGKAAPSAKLELLLDLIHDLRLDSHGFHRIPPKFQAAPRPPSRAG